jgi:SNF2 family DNA or RNA helicase
MYVTSDKRHIVVPYHEALARAVPHARKLIWQNQNMLVLPNLADETRVARNLGINIPPPIETVYDYRKTIPWAIQRQTAALLTESPRCYVLSELGTGKTRAVLYAADYLIRSGMARRMLVVAPLSTLTPVWERECFALMMPKPVVLYGPREKRLDLLARGTGICIINHHGVRVLGQALREADFDIIVIDELAIYRNKRTDLWAAANALIERAPYAWGLTGSPTPNDPTDAWAQIKLLTPARTTRTFTAFRDMTMSRVSTFKWVARSNANAVVHASMQPSVRFKRDDVMELPDCITVEREAQLDDAAAKAYRALYNQARLLCTNGQTITAQNEGILQSKLLQASCGYIYTDEKTVHELPATKRLAALDELLAETERKIIVLVPFIHALTGVAKYLTDHKHSVAVVHGGTSRKDRDNIFTGFQTRPTPRVIVAHPGVLAHGLTLTEANTIIWYSPTTSLEWYEQANARINRPGQTSKMLIAHLVGTEVERATYARLRNKQRMQNCLLELFAKQKKE